MAQDQPACLVFFPKRDLISSLYAWKEVNVDSFVSYNLSSKWLCPARWPLCICSDAHLERGKQCYFLFKEWISTKAYTMKNEKRIWPLLQLWQNYWKRKLISKCSTHYRYKWVLDFGNTLKQRRCPFLCRYWLKVLFSISDIDSKRSQFKFMKIST